MSEKPAERPRGAGGVAGVTAVLAFLLGLDGLRCLDVWFHLRTGQIIAATGSVPRVDTLSHTRAGAAWITHEWGFELPLYWLWTVVGNGGLVVFKGCLAAAAAALLVRAVAWAGAAPLAAGIAVGSGLFVAASRIVVRPHMASAVLAAAFLLLGFRHLVRSDRWLWLAVPLALAWANVHAGVVVGVGILGTFAIDEAVARRRPGQAAWVTLAAAAAALANPHGWRVYWYPFWLVDANNRGLFRILELDRPTFPSPVHLLALVALLLGLAARRATRPAHWILAAAGAWIGLTRLRGSLDLALMGAPLLAVGLGVLAPGRRLSGRLSAGALALLAALGLALSGWRPRLAVDGWAIPEGAMAFADRAGLQGQLLNSHAFGGWIAWAWPDRPVFIDGRNEVYLDLFAETQESAIDQLSLRYDLGYAVVEYPLDDERREVELPVDLSDELVASDDWVLVWFDDVARVYARHRPENEAAIARYGYRRLRPGWEDLSYVARYLGDAAEAAAFEEEARRAVATVPGSRVARMHLAEYLRLAGRFSEALAELDQADPDDPFVLGRRGGVVLQLGRADEAVAPLEAALVRAPDNAATWSNLGLARLRAGDATGAIEAFDRALAEDPDQLTARANLVLALRAAGRQADAAAAEQAADALAERLAREAFAAGQRYLEAGLPERAIVELQRAVALRPRAPNSRYLLGVAFNLAGEPDLAEGELGQVLQLQPAHPYARLELAQAVAAQGRAPEARALLEAFLAQGPEPRWEAVARDRLAALQVAP